MVYYLTIQRVNLIKFDKTIVVLYHVNSHNINLFVRRTKNEISIFNMKFGIQRVLLEPGGPGNE